MVCLNGCADGNVPLREAMELREDIQSSAGCVFNATVTADYGEKIYIFSMDCQTDQEGNLSFTVVKPETISGISGRVSANNGALTFDDQVLAFQTMADGLVTPVSAPWILINTLRSGYLKSCAKNDKGFEIAADDSYGDASLHLQILVNGNVPTFAEIFLNGRRMITISVEGFRLL